MFPQGRGILEKIAKKIVRDCLRIKKNDMVTINTWHHTIDLAEVLAFECYKVGAIPLITLMTDNLWYRIMSEVPSKNLTKTPLHVLKSLEGQTVCINIHGPEKPPSPDRGWAPNMDAIRRAYEPIGERERELKIRVADVYLGKITPQRAKIYGFNYEKWRTMILEALAVSYGEIRDLGMKIAKILEKAREVRITSNVGTNIKFRINGRRPKIDDGVIDDRDIELGDTFTMLPSGMVEIAPIEDTANGTVIFDGPHPLMGKYIKNMRWVFREGRLVDIDAEENLEIFKEIYKAIAGDRDRIGRFIIGLNSAIKPYGIFTSLALGTVSIGIGYNEDLGGKNKATAWHGAAILEPTVEIDGKILLKKGKLLQ